MACHSPNTQPFTHPTTLWRRLENGKVQCDVCPRACHLDEGQRGACYVRGCENQQIYLYSYGRSSGFCIDPIEKKPLNHFYPGSPVLSLGTAGCNLACKFCQNWDISKSRSMDTVASVAMPEQLVAAARRYHCRSIAFTYNDPAVFLEYALDTAVCAREAGVKSVAVTAGYFTQAAREQFFPQMDAANVDLKAFTERFYHKLCGASLQPVLDTLLYLRDLGSVWYEITTLLIPGENDSNEEISALCRWIVDNLGTEIPLHFSAFHPDFKMINTPATPLATLVKARDIALTHGLHYVYMGNLPNVEGVSTYCPGCGRAVIERHGYRIEHYMLSATGHCRYCDHNIPGCFDATAGDWGNQRQPVFIN